MVDIYFVGEINYAMLDATCVSATWAIVPGNSAWSVRNGLACGETQISDRGIDGCNVFNHPIDIQFETASSEGWPFFVCELWDKSTAPLRNFLGCGCVWLPTAPGHHILDIHLWRPVSEGMDQITELWLPHCPDLKILRELVVKPYTRSAVQTDSVGIVRISVHVVHSGLEIQGVRTYESNSSSETIMHSAAMSTKTK